MIAEYIAKIQENPDWIGYGLLALAIMLVTSVTLYLTRRRAQLHEAHSEISVLIERLEEKAGEITEANQILSELRAENIAQQNDLSAFDALEPQRKQQELELREMRESYNNERATTARLTEALSQQEKANAEKVELLNQTGEKLKGEFKVLASQVLRSHSEDFKSSSKEQLAQTLQPLKEHIGRFESELRNVHQAAGKDRAALSAEIKSLTERSLQVSQEAENLTRALKSDAQQQGAWGEMILASILDRSGLREGEEYETQTHHRSDDGSALRPDVLVNLPGGRRLVIDSKVSLVAYERSVNAESEAAREIALKAHVASVKKHIDTLAEKKYHQLDDGAVEYVIMFMPIESAFSEAVKARDDLALYANDKNVVIASPTNLMVALKTVENLWSVERRNKNAVEIAKRAGLLYDKFHGFAEDLKKVGEQLDRAQGSHAAAMGKLVDGRGNLVSQVEALKKLGARASKQIELEHDEEELADDLLPKPPKGVLKP